MTTEIEGRAGLTIRPDERALLGEQVAEFAETLTEPAARERYFALAEAVDQGEVPPDLAGPLAALLDLLLQTGRVRQQRGPEAEQALTAVYYRTARGAGLRQAAQAVNRALAVLGGQTLAGLSLSAGPGRYTLVIETDRCRLALRLDAAGARLDRLEVSG